jgi:lysophospholipase L1-like esterase
VRWLLPALVVLALVSTGCAAGGGDHEEGFGSYVAIGDSYTAGAGTGPVVAGPGGVCAQVRGSYPRLVATELGARLHDASCAGARTSNATEPQVTGSGATWPPQLAALSADTALVTVGLGFNDDGYFGDATLGCAAVAAKDPDGAPCRDLGAGAQRTAPSTSADRIGDRLHDLLGEVQDRAPRAEVLLVGYPQLVPASGTCPRLPLAAGDYAYVRSQFELLDEAMRRAATDAGVEFVDVHAASAGHDICAGDDAWVNGAGPTAGAAAYHPFAEEQQAVADLILAQVS